MHNDLTSDHPAAETRLAAPTSCPHLGTDQDAGVCYSFANKRNHCYRKEPPFPVALDHQDACCLSKNHIDCPLFQAEGKLKKVPRDFIGESSEHKKKKNIWAYLLFSVAVIIIGVIFSLAFLNQHGIDNLAFLSTSPEEPFQSPPTAVSEITPTPNPGDMLNLIFLYPRETGETPTEKTPSPTNSPLYPTPGPPYGQPFGKEDAYVLHLVGKFESYHYIADLYDTSVEAIQVLNSIYNGNPLVLDQVIVVKPGEKSTENLPRFGLIQLQGDTLVELIANHYEISEASLAEINDLGEINFVPAGRWLLIPIEE